VSAVDGAEPLLHVALRDELEAARGGSHYSPAGFPDEGFVHCCRPGQLAGVLERYFRGRDDLVLLELDPAALDARLVEEDTTGRGERFPHLYGPVPWRAVQRESPLPPPA
jgi:glutathione S-transferase